MPTELTKQLELVTKERDEAREQVKALTHAAKVARKALQDIKTGRKPTAGINALIALNEVLGQPDAQPDA